MKLAFFGYAWGVEEKIDAYMQATIDGFVELGYDVDVFRGNQFSNRHGVVGWSDDMSFDRFLQFIRLKRYDVAVSFNNSLVMPETLEALRGAPVVSVIVDAVSHQFTYNDADRYFSFTLPVQFAVLSTQLEDEIRAATPAIGERLRMLPPATNGVRIPREGAAPLYPISWVASFLGDSAIDQYLAFIMKDRAYFDITAACLAVIEAKGDLSDFRGEGDNPVKSYVQLLPWTFDYFEIQLQSLITNRQRVALVEKLAPLGLSLFGNPGWAKAMLSNPAVFRCFAAGPAVSEQAELQAIYNASLISVNLPQVFVKDAFQYRVIDVMASNALLVTKRSPNPDIHRVFGEDCPVPLFDDLDELQSICAHYLAHESERRALVEHANRLVAHGFSFFDRCLDLLQLCGLEDGARPQPGDREPGAVNYHHAMIFKKLSQAV